MKIAVYLFGFSQLLLECRETETATQILVSLFSPIFISRTAVGDNGLQALIELYTKQDYPTLDVQLVVSGSLFPCVCVCVCVWLPK